MAKGFNVQEFKSVIDRNRGLRSANKFLVEFPVPRGLQKLSTNSVNARTGLVSFYCKATSLPGVGFLSTGLSRYGYGPTEYKPYGIVVNDIMMMFYMDGDDKIKTWFTEWMRLIINFATNDGMNSINSSNNARAYEHEYKENYAVDITITTFTSEGREASRIVLTEAFPNFMGDVMMDWDAKNQLMILPIALSFKDWYEEKNTRPIVDVINPDTGLPYPKD